MISIRWALVSPGAIPPGPKFEKRGGAFFPENLEKAGSGPQNSKSRL